MGLVDSWAGVAGWMMGRRKWEGLASIAQREESAGLLVSLVSLQNGNIRGIIRQPPRYLNTTQLGAVVEWPSRYPTFRWFKVRFVRTGTEMACRYIVEVTSLL